MRDIDKISYYVDLDCLFDTKLAVLLLCFKKFATKYLKYPYFWYRTSDNFTLNTDILDSNLFNIFYNKRNLDILNVAPLTSIPYILFKVIQEHFATYQLGRGMSTPSIIINSYPYVLNEKIEANIIKLLDVYVNYSFEINFVRIAPADLSLDFLEANQVEVLFKLDGLDWFNLIDKEEILKRPVVNLKLIVPKFIPTIAEPNKEFFEMMEERHTRFIDLEFLDMNYFCASLNPGEEEATAHFLDLMAEDGQFKREVMTQILDNVKAKKRSN